MNISLPFSPMIRKSLTCLILLAMTTSYTSALDNTELISQDVQASPTYSYQTFASCGEFESTMKKLLSKTASSGYGGGIYPLSDARMSVGTVAAPTAVAMEKSVTSSAISALVPQSETNTQVIGIDEPDTVKTDGKYIYTFQETGDRRIIILDAKTLDQVKLIRVPSNYSGVSFYINKTNLVILATKYSSYNARWYGWYNNTATSIIALYDIRDLAKPSLVRTLQVEGTLSDSRFSDDGILTAVTSNSYSMPPIYMMSKMANPVYEYSTKTLIPRIIDTRLAKGKYTTETRTITECKNM